MSYTFSPQNLSDEERHGFAQAYGCRPHCRKATPVELALDPHVCCCGQCSLPRSSTQSPNQDAVDQLRSLMKL